MRFSIIIPVFNEEKRLAESLAELLEFADRRSPNCELLFVDDGSGDGTGEVLQNATARSEAVRVLSFTANVGKGGAIRKGMAEAHGDIVLFMDVDLSTPLVYVDAVLAAFEEESVDIAIGSRRVPGAAIVGHQTWTRESMGRVFTFLSSLLVPGIKDFTCGMKAFRAEVGKRLFANGVVNDWSFDTEILYLAHKTGWRIVQVPVSWRDVEGSKVRVARNAIISLYQLVALPLRYRFSSRYAALKEGLA